MPTASSEIGYDFSGLANRCVVVLTEAGLAPTGLSERPIAGRVRAVVSRTGARDRVRFSAGKRKTRDL